MDIPESSYPFPQNVIRYSASKYLQKKITAMCSNHSYSFESIEEWKKFKISLRNTLKDILPVFETGDPRESLLTTVIDLGEDLVLEAIDVHFDEQFHIPVHLYRQKGREASRPAVLVCPGFTHRKNDPCYVDMCIALAKTGISAVSVEYDAAGERAERPDGITDINNVTALANLIGINNVGLRVMTNLAVLNYLKTREDVQVEKIGITGLCQGSVITWFSAAVCDDFSAVAPLCGATTYEAIALEYVNRQGGWTGISSYVFNILKYGDIPHVLACVAPRSLFVQNNIIDKHFPYSGFEKVRKLVTHIYDLYNAAESSTFLVEHGPHAYAEPFISNIAGWFSKVFEDKD